MSYHYTQQDPHWVEAQSVEAATPDCIYVNVTVNGETFRMCRVGWSNYVFDKSKSDVLVQNKEGDWLKVWFYDTDVKPYKG